MQEELEEFLSEGRKREPNPWGFVTGSESSSPPSLCLFHSSPYLWGAGIPHRGTGHQPFVPVFEERPKSSKLRVPLKPLIQPFGRAGPSALPCVPPEPSERSVHTHSDKCWDENCRWVLSTCSAQILSFPLDTGCPTDTIPWHSGRDLHEPCGTLTLGTLSPLSNVGATGQWVQPTGFCTRRKWQKTANVESKKLRNWPQTVLKDRSHPMWRQELSKSHSQKIKRSFSLYGNPYTAFPHGGGLKREIHAAKLLWMRALQNTRNIPVSFQTSVSVQLEMVTLPQITDYRIWAELSFLRDCLKQLFFLCFPVKGLSEAFTKTNNPPLF